MTQAPSGHAAAGERAADCDGLVPGLDSAIAAQLRAAGLDPDAVRSVAAAALAEDLAGGSDVTTASTVPAAERGRADLAARTPGGVAGLPVAAAVFWLVSPDVQIAPQATDGDRIAAGQPVLTVSGPIGPMLTA